jgi:bifunctional non-homologous end joining protein LigD
MAKTSLMKYRAKRDFSQTAEPSGDARIKQAKRLRFVIQKHAAAHLHYDLRLELNGVFKSWAVTKGPSLDPTTNGLPSRSRTTRRIMATSRARSPGEVRGGTVMVWDRGYWGCEEPQKPYRKGKLDFILDGEKLQCGWMLTRMSEREKCAPTGC